MTAHARIVAVAVAVMVNTVAAQPKSGTVALLPLDAEPRFEIYGQPVASEIARALIAAGVDVTVVGPKMAVPERASLIVDGAIAARRPSRDAVTLTIRVRNPRDGTTLETLEETATSLGTIDRAAAALSARVVPVVRARIFDERRDDTSRAVRGNGEPARVEPPGPVAQPPPATPAGAPVLIGVTTTGVAMVVGDPLRDALALAAFAWARDHHRRPIDAADAAAVAVTKPDRTITLEIVRYEVVGAWIPLARARVRVRISGARSPEFDRVVVTDTIVGDRDQPRDALATRVAREVLEILRPHMRRLEPGW